MPLQKLPVTGLDDINHRRRARETLNNVLDHSFDDSRVQTSAEKITDSSILNPAYPPGDVRRYGVKGNGTDESSSFQAAINQAAQSGGSPVYIPKGILTVGSPIQLLDNVEITGAGKKLTSIRALAGSGDSVSTILYGSGVSGFQLRNMTLNGNLTNITPTASHANLFLSGCSDFLIDNIRSIDAGRTVASPLGQHIIISVSEPGENATGSAFDVDDIASLNWLIRNCDFEDPDFICEFGIRVYSNFQSTIADDDFTIFNTGNIVDCNFDGFMWNPIELCGPAVRYCNVVRAKSKNSQGYGAVDADKGARWNNIIECDAYDPDVVKVDQFGFRIQGENATGGAPKRTAKGNRLINCRAHRFVGTTTNRPGGAWVNIAEDTTVENFDVIDIDDGAGTQAVAAIRVDDATDTTIRGGNWENPVIGVFLGPKPITGLKISGVTASPQLGFLHTNLGDTQVGIESFDNTTTIGTSGIFTGTLNRDINIRQAFNFQTTAAGPTSALSLPLADETAYRIEIKVVATQSDGSNRAIYHRMALVYRDAAGGATIQGAVQDVTTAVESNAAWDATIGTSGNNVTFPLTGVAATTINWRIELFVRSVS
jgi:hypothetical protein